MKTIFSGKLRLVLCALTAAALLLTGVTAGALSYAEIDPFACACYRPKVEKHYDADGELVEYREYFTDEDGYLTQIITCRDDTKTSELSRDLYTYSQDRKTETVENYDSAADIPYLSRKTVLTFRDPYDPYNSDDAIVMSSVVYSFDESGAVIRATKTVNSLSDGDKTLVSEEYDYADGDFRLYEKNTVTYSKEAFSDDPDNEMRMVEFLEYAPDGSVSSGTRYVWSEEKDNARTSEMYRYDPETKKMKLVELYVTEITREGGKVVEENTHIFDGEGFETDPPERVTYEYPDDTTEIITYLDSDGKGGWIPDDRIERKTDGNGHDVQEIYYAYEDGRWVIEDRYTEEYDENGNLTADLYESREDHPTLQPEFKYTYEYDADGHEIRNTEYSDFTADESLIDSEPGWEAKYLASGRFAYLFSDVREFKNGAHVKAWQEVTEDGKTRVISSAECEYTEEHTRFELCEGLEPTKETAGHKAYYRCACGRCYEDAAHTRVIEDIEAWKAEGGAGYLPKIGDIEAPDTGDANVTAFILAAVTLALTAAVILRKKRYN